MSVSETEGHRFDSCQARHLLTLLFCLFSVNAHSVEPRQHWQQTDYITASFIDIALNNEYSNKTSKLRKWLRPIHYSIIDRSADRLLHQSLTEQHLQHLSAITKHPILAASQRGKANLTIIFSSENRLVQELIDTGFAQSEQQAKKIAYGSICLARITTNTNHEIKHASVIIPVDRARAHGKLLSCIVEELTQIMGLVNDSDAVFPSIFNDKSHDAFLSGLDYLLLNLLYHPSLKVGTELTSLKPMLVRVIQSQPFQNKVKNADVLVKQKGLSLLIP